MEASPEHLLAWFRLRSVVGIGNLLFRRLIQHFDNPEAVFASSDDALLAVEGVSPRLVAAIRRQPARNAVPGGIPASRAGKLSAGDSDFRRFSAGQAKRRPRQLLHT